MTENWKDIVGYEGLYQVSDKGSVKSIGYGKERILSPGKLQNGYLRVNLCKNGEKKNLLVHRLVAQAFIPNPDNLPEVNHKDEDKENNSVQNLEWCDGKYNINYGTRNQRVSKPILQYTKSGKLVREWKSIMDVQRNLGYSNGSISSCCTGRRKSANGFIWRFND